MTRAVSAQLTAQRLKPLVEILDDAVINVADIGHQIGDLNKACEHCNI